MLFNRKGMSLMSATVHALGRPAAAHPPLARDSRAAPPPVPSDLAWLVDVGALAQCRALLSGHEFAAAGSPRTSQLALLDVPLPYEQFCRSHFAAVRRLHPDMSWDDACPAYAIALSAHAVLCDALDEERERQLERHWTLIRGGSRLDWPQARGLVADGCSALTRLDPLAMHR